MPLTVIAGVLFIYLMGYTLNTVTLFGSGAVGGHTHNELDCRSRSITTKNQRR